MSRLNATHDPALTSWVASANDGRTHFPIQNLPWGVFSILDDAPSATVEAAQGRHKRVGVAIGDRILDVTLLEDAGLLTLGPRRLFSGGALNPLMAEHRSVWSAARAQISRLLADGDAGLKGSSLGDRALVPMDRAHLHMPFHVAGYTDFYASKYHATNVGTIVRGPENALPANWLSIPIGYNGRASTVVVSGTDVRRPLGQLKGPDDDLPRLGASERLDIELELGAIVGTPTKMGEVIDTARAADMIFGYVLLNDWSARDIQVWEYHPLGPFQSKAFATSISPWIVTAEALEPYRVPTPERERPLLPYLTEDADRNLDIDLSVALAPEGQDDTVIARSNAKHLYYSSAQQLTHHALSGCAMRTGDLLGSGTISGPTQDSAGCLLELTWNGRDPVAVAGGTRVFLQDGDRVTLSGVCEGEVRIGFGECTGTILPAHAP